MKVTDKKIGVLLGGLSSEREVSLASGAAILKALQGKGYNAAAVDVGRDVAERIRSEKIEVAFIGLHGKYGEDGAIQGLLEVMGITYTGSGVLASAMGMDKVVSKRMFAAGKLLVGPYAVVAETGKAEAQKAVQSIGLPVVVKPVAEGSSVGVSLVHRTEELRPALDLAFQYGSEILVEKYIRGKEVQVGILADRALGAIEIVPKEAFYNYKAKYEKGMSDHFFPARIPPQAYDRTLELGLAAHRELGCGGYSRVDFIVDERGDAYILEVNTLPGMTATSLLPEIAAGVGISFPDLVEEILRQAVEADA
ncbi:MAG: D-alanine--D-alanine ligase [Nitrospirae bacterium GWC2_57_13]|jgi:D-alanine-D-alanine ligase|nr:MAG: D-alanine--D-alanine ligase [Nitrospirae bacterium GWC1_57_7]OGW27237.1 MAG: D-alanine--D-alanine ligase [Nitrospirae bacterium GWC2_57_13]OGW45776.1 MAG: D-alanine--D-alanine ligase [Nitrospirae bacterium GWD2_57_8]HAR45143.1 D-alanine--D-alanine ligase [Nitrospiraceae bacterium]